MLNAPFIASISLLLAWIAATAYCSSAASSVRHSYSHCSIPGISQADPLGSPPIRRLKQLTHSPCEPAAIDFGDPSPPHVENDGSISIFGSDILNWRGTSESDSWSRFLRAEPANYEALKIFHSDGVTPFQHEKFKDDVWDATIEDVSVEAWNLVRLPPVTSKVLYGGAMAAPHGSLHAVYDRDNWSRVL